MGNEVSCKAMVVRRYRATSRENLSSGFPTRSGTNWAVLPEKMIRGLKFRNKKEAGIYRSSENNGADQLREDDMRFWFRICKKLDFS